MSTKNIGAFGGCPQYQVQATLKQGPAQMGGRAAFGTQSTPPDYYRKVSWDGSGWKWSTFDLNSGGAHVSDVTFSGNGLSDYAFDPATGWPLPGGPESDCTVQTTTFPPYGSGTINAHPLVENEIVGLTVITGTGASGGIAPSLHDYFTGQVYFDMGFTILSQTSAKFTMASNSATISSPHTREDIMAGEIVLTFSDPDTETDAYARAIASASPTAPITAGPDFGDIFNAEIFSLRETRSTGAFRNFGCQEATYSVLGSNIAPLMNCHVVEIYEAIDAVGDSSGDYLAGTGDLTDYGSTWTYFSTVAYDIRADSSGNFASTPSIFPNAIGKLIRLKSITITPING